MWAEFRAGFAASIRDTLRVFMFGWLRKPDPLVRGLYRYHDGRRNRLADPLVVEGKMESAVKNWRDHLAALDSVTSVATSGNLAKIATARGDEAVRELVKATRAGFDLKDAEFHGLSSSESLHVLAGYLTFLGRLKEFHGPLSVPPARPASDSDTGDWSPPGSSGMIADASV